jgi:hypothetical protein
MQQFLRNQKPNRRLEHPIPHFINMRGIIILGTSRPVVLNGADKILITAAALGSNKTRAAFKLSVNNTVQQIMSRDQWQVSFIDSAKDPLLWATDYCAWAIQRKWERNDTRSYDLIKSKIRTEFDLWKNGTKHYY